MMIQANAGAIPLGDESVQCVVTSPPYWGLRKYKGAQELVWGGTNGCEHEWGEREDRSDVREETQSGKEPLRKFNGNHQKHSTVCFCQLCGAWRGAFGLEPRIEMYVQHTVEILREVRRVLRSDGVCFWNIGDSYSGSWGNQGRKPDRGTQRPINGPMMQPVYDGRYPSAGSNTGKIVDAGLKPKDMCLIPFRVALAAQADGWWVRSVIIWSKNNPMPESVQDRPTTAHEYILMLTRSEDYFWDAEAVKERACESSLERISQANFANQTGGPKDYANTGVNPNRSARKALENFADNGGSRNLRSVWTFPSQAFSGSHFATFPEELVYRCIAAGTSERGCCAECGAPWERITEKRRLLDGESEVSGGWQQNQAGQIGANGKGHWRIKSESSTTGWRPTCKHVGEPVPCTVLDPFSGSGTTVEVARKMGRRAIGVDISAEYLRMGQDRVGRLLLAMPSF